MVEGVGEGGEATSRSPGVFLGSSSTPQGPGWSRAAQTAPGSAAGPRQAKEFLPPSPGAVARAAPRAETDTVN